MRERGREGGRPRNWCVNEEIAARQPPLPLGRGDDAVEEEEEEGRAALAVEEESCC